jgi:hypothetical protein
MDRTDDLVEVLSSLGVDVRSSHGDEINARCPVHPWMKGRESTRYTFYLNVDSGLWHCFTCGARGNLSMLISELSPDPAALWKVQSHIIASGLRRLEPDEAVYDPGPSVDWVTYGQFLSLPRSIVELRMFDPEVAERYGIRWDNERKATVAPIVSPLGELRGWQSKKTGWVRNYPEGVNKSTTLFGIERAFAPTAVLVESPLDVPRFHSAYKGLEYSCVASFGANLSIEQCRLLSKFDTVIMALDNDGAGYTESARLRRLEAIQPRKGVRYWNYHSESKDIGEMLSAEILIGLEQTSKVQLVPRRATSVPD